MRPWNRESVTRDDSYWALFQIYTIYQGKKLKLGFGQAWVMSYSVQKKCWRWSSRIKQKTMKNTCVPPMLLSITWIFFPNSTFICKIRNIPSNDRLKSKEYAMHLNKLPCTALVETQVEQKSAVISGWQPSQNTQPPLCVCFAWHNNAWTLPTWTMDMNWWFFVQCCNVCFPRKALSTHKNRHMFWISTCCFIILVDLVEGDGSPHRDMGTVVHSQGWLFTHWNRMRIYLVNVHPTRTPHRALYIYTFHSHVAYHELHFCWPVHLQWWRRLLRHLL